MRFTKLVTFAFTSFLMTTLPTFGNQLSEDEVAFRASSDYLEHLSQQSALQPIVTEGARILSVVARASSNKGDGTETKVIAIPEGWAYYSHATQELSKHFNYKVDTSLKRDPTNPSRIIEVSLKAEAFSDLNNWFDFSHKGHRAWIDVRLDVVIVPLKG